MSLVISSLFVAAVIFLIQYHWRRRHIYRLASKLPGPVALPIIGNALKFMCPPEDILGVFTNIFSSYSNPIRFWFGPDLIIFFTYPQHIEKILSSSKLVHKHDFYDLIKVYLGDGLICNSGEKYKKHRKLIQPLISLKFAIGNMETFQRQINILLERLEVHTDKKTFDVQYLIHECFADIIGESLLGTQIDIQHGKNKEYVQATTDMYVVGYNRMMSPWFHSDLTYNFTQGKKQQDRILSVVSRFIKDAIAKARSRTITKNRKDGGLEDPTSPVIDQIANIIEKDPNSINDTDFFHHLFTLYIASEDTMTIIASALCVCLGMYPEYQKIAAEEIRSVIGETIKDFTYEDIVKLQYLDMCVRDALRLMPIAPFVIRKTIEDFEIDTYTIPKGCGISVSIYNVHRDPKHWENPEHFHPDHFLPEVVQKRHPFAYVPFSAGPRSCVGKVLAHIGLKVIMAKILQRFEIEADGKFPDVPLRCDVSVRFRNGYDVRLKKRIWT